MLEFAVILIILALLIQRYTLHKGFVGINHSIRASAPTVEPDEPFEVITELVNGTWRFVPFLRMRELLPPEAIVLTSGIKTQESTQEPLQLIYSNVYLMPKQRLERRVSICLKNRGCYFLRGAILEISDFLGLYEAIKRFSLLHEVVVIPRALNNERVIATLGGFLGDISARRFIIEDPVLTLGFREYTMREPMKMISWTQTARKGELIVKTLDYTLEPAITVLLNIESAVPLGRLAPLIEVCYSLSRTVCEFLEDSRIKYRFISNADTAGAISLWNTIDEGLGRRHCMAILEGLGRATYSYTESYDLLLERGADKAQMGYSYIIITPHVSDKSHIGVKRLSSSYSGQVCVIAAEEII